MSLYFMVSYTQPADTYTGQGWDRAMSWVFLGMLVGASALAIAVVRLPVSYRRLLARPELIRVGHRLVGG